MKIWIRNKSRLDSRCQINGAGSNFLTYWLAPLFLVLMVALGQAWGVENTVYQWPPGAPTTDPLSALGQSWPGTWTPVTSLNDPNDGNAATLEFVGDALNPGFYIARTNDYLFFRIRMNYSGVVSTTVDNKGHYSPFDGNSIMLVISNGETFGTPNWGFAWDFKETAESHGMEFLTFNSTDGKWNKTDLKDMDAVPI